MKHFIFVIAMSLFLQEAGARETTFDMIPGNAPVKLLSFNKQTLFVGTRTVSLIRKDKLVTIIEQAATISAATIDGNDLWLGTDKGVQVYDLNDYKLKQTYFPSTRISGVATDAFNRIWVATSLKGVYMKHNDSFINKVNISCVYALECTADSNIWVGTNIGLYRIAGSDFKTTRYAEEGYSGYELPDNIVEKLYKDESSNIWVIMPDNISFKRSARYQGEIPTYAYVGDKQNAVKAIVPVAGSAYVFVTEKGLFFLPAASIKDEHDNHGSEVFTADNAQAFALTPKQLSIPEKLISSPVTYAGKAGGELYFITAEGGWRIKEKELIKRIAKH